jgi:preprotein translocase subunit SecD
MRGHGSRSFAAAVLASVVALVVLAASSCSDPGTDDVVADVDVATVVVDVPDATPEQLASAAEVVRRRLASLDLPLSEVGWDGAAIEAIVPAGDEDLVRQALQPIDGLTFRPVQAVPADASTPTTPPEQRSSDAEVTLADEDGTVYLLGPTAVDSSAVERASAELSESDQWTVLPVFADGSDGIDEFNAIAAECFAANPEVCPALSTFDESGVGRGLLAIVADDVVLSAPSINSPVFERDQIQISGSFDEQSAKALAAALDGGAANVPWTVRG